jgi:hypothetical protein
MCSHNYKLLEVNTSSDLKIFLLLFLFCLEPLQEKIGIKLCLILQEIHHIHAFLVTLVETVNY